LSDTQGFVAASRQHKQALVVDGAGNSCLNKPGFRYDANTTRRAIADAAKAMAYEDVEEATNTAWKGVTNTTDPFRGSQEGDLCTCRGPEYPLDFGNPGTLQIGSDGQLVCVPDNPRQDARRLDAEQAAHEAYDRAMANAWRTSR
jgi:hypothetical protein